MLNIRIDNRIRIQGELPEEVRDAIRSEFTYDNPAYAKAQAFGFYKRVPKYLTSWEESKNPPELSVPRGGYARIVELLFGHGLSVKIDPQSSAGDLVRIPQSQVVPYDYQVRLIAAALKKFEQVDGVALWRSVQASGKTTAALILATKLRLKTLVIISNSVLMRQWSDRVKSELGFTPGIVGGGKYDVEPPIVIAMQQSLKRMPAKDVGRFGLIIGDEIQLFAADTFQSSIDRFPAKCRLGVSGDERRADRKECLVYDQFGPVTAQVKADELVAAGRIHEVEIRVVPSDLRVDWWTAIGECPKNEGESDDQWAQRRRATKIRMGERLAEELGADSTRNELVVQLVVESVEQTGQALVLSTRREHCHVLDAALTARGLKSGLLIGGVEYRDEFDRTLRAFVSQSIQAAVGTYQAIGVGFDLPAAARGVCAAPVANAEGGAMQWRQYRGRFARTNAKGGKADAALYYVWDRFVFGSKPLRHLIRWNSNVVVRSADGSWVPARSWLEQWENTDGQKAKRHAASKQTRIPGFDTDPAIRPQDGSGNRREPGVGVSSGRRTRTQSGGRRG